MSDETMAQGEKDAQLYRTLVRDRTRQADEELACPAQRVSGEPCVARDGKLAVALALGLGAICVGCERPLKELLAEEKEKRNAPRDR